MDGTVCTGFSADNTPAHAGFPASRAEPVRQLGHGQEVQRRTPVDDETVVARRKTVEKDLVNTRLDALQNTAQIDGAGSSLGDAAPPAVIS